MNNFIFENSTKVYFGRNCVKEYLSHNVRNYKVVMLAYGGGSVKKNGIYDQVVSILKAAGKEIFEDPGVMPNSHNGKTL